MNNYPTTLEIQQTASVLRRLPRGFLPLEIFEAIAEKTVLSCLELSIFRLNRGRAEVLLTQRPKDDHYWPNAWHLPGGVLLATDKLGGYSSMFERILEKELKGEQELLYEPEFVMHRFQETKRGGELVLEYVSQVAYSDGVLHEGKFFPVDALPDKILTQYLEIIPAAVAAFKKHQLRKSGGL